MLKKALIYLGLGPDEEYEQFDEFAPAGPARNAEAERPVVHAVPETPSRPVSSTVRPIPTTSQPSTVRVVPADNQ